LIGLKWEDIDFINKNISIKRTIGRGIIGSPKTSSSIRNIPIFNILLPYLENQYNLTGKYNSFIFLNSQNNHFFDAKNIRDGLWKKVLKKAQIKYRTVYQTRHTFCSINLQSGTDLIWISKMMGHKNPKITLERYSKYIPINNDYSSVFDSVI
jgi:integrase